jgi:hypothetical protein
MVSVNIFQKIYHFPFILTSNYKIIVLMKPNCHRIIVAAFKLEENIFETYF